MKAVDKWGKVSGAKGRRCPPDKVAVMGPQGHGKSTLAAQWPDALVIDMGKSTDALDVWCRVEPLPETFSELVGLLEYIPEHPVWKNAKTVVLDDVGLVEQRLIHPEVVTRYREQNPSAKKVPDTVGDIDFAAGYKLAKPLWDKLFQSVNALQARTGVNFIVVGHSTIAGVKNLAGVDYSTVTFDLYAGNNANAGDWLCRWADTVLLMHRDDEVVEEVNIMGKKTKKGRVHNVGDLYVLTMPRPWCLQPKNRYGLPDPMPPSYAEYARHKQAFFDANSRVAEDDPDRLLAMVEGLLAEVGQWEAPDWREKKFQPHLDLAGRNADRLRVLYAQLSDKISKRRQFEEQGQAAGEQGQAA